MGDSRTFLSQCAALVAVAAVLCVGAYFTCGAPGVGWVAAMGLVAVAFFAAISVRRRREIMGLAEEIDQVLHGRRHVSFSQCKEGDVAILRNELEKMVARLVRTAQQLEDEKQRLGRALEDISHQIRTPLTAIMLMLPSLETAQDERERKRLTADLDHMIERLSWLVTTLLKMAKFETGNYTLDEAVCLVRDVAEGAAEPLRMAFDLHNIMLTDDIAADATMVMDRRWMGEALGNILKNCMEHTPDGGTISLSFQEDALACTLTVSDTGAGIAAEDLPHVFERFYRGQDEENGTRGFGIGLAFAQAVANAHGGTIRAGNTPQGGAHFELVFPKLTV